jgi:eukaryotic-like serine/threonine-protein kinase
MPIASGTRLGYYEIKSLLGVGGMGEVYLAHDTKLRRLVALKLLPAEQTSSRERLARFEREAHAASRLNHPNILTIHEIGEADGCRFISSEFIEGQSLRQHTARGPMDLMEAIDTTIQIASALSVAHQAGIVHRDIKPENIMIRKDGLVKILDFGLAKLISKSQEDSDKDNSDTPIQTKTNTVAGRVLGTVTYMSPEQTRGPHVDERGDIWSLGVVLYEIITGTTPFQGETQSDMIAAILKTDPPPLHTFAPEAPPELQQIVTKMLCKDRSLRYKRSLDVVSSLKELKQELVLRDRIGGLRSTSANASSKTGANSEPRSVSIGEQLRTQQGSRIEFLVSEIMRRKLSVILVAFIILTGLAAHRYFTREGTASPINSIAVLPFSNEGGDQNLEYLSDGLSESVINRLSQSSQLRLIASSSSFKYKGKEIDPKEVAQALGVQALVIGSVRYRGNDFHITVEVVDARDMTRLWGDAYDRRAADLDQTVAEIAREISSKLKLSLSIEQQKRVTEITTSDGDAYQLYLKGRFNWNKLTEEGLNKSIQFFNEALEKDPKYARAYAGLANSYSALGANYLRPQDTYPKSRFFARKALELDDSLAEAHYATAVVKFFDEWNLKEAEKELSRTLELNPNFAPAHSLRCTLSLARGQTNDAISHIKRAIELDPFSVIFNIHLVSAYYYSRQYARAQEQMNKVLEIEPSAGSFLKAEIAVNYAQMGSYDQAFAACQEALAAEPNHPSVLSSVGLAFAVSGKTKEAEDTIEKLNALAKKGYVQPYLFAVVYAPLGRKDEAFAALEKVVEERSALLGRLKLDPAFDKLRSDARFAELLRRSHLAE